MEFINPSLQTLLIFSLSNTSPQRDESEKLMAKEKGVEPPPNKCHHRPLLHVNFSVKVVCLLGNVFCCYSVLFLTVSMLDVQLALIK